MKRKKHHAIPHNQFGRHSFETNTSMSQLLGHVHCDAANPAIHFKVTAWTTTVSLRTRESLPLHSKILVLVSCANFSAARIVKKRICRQYMNRKAGFNRPLDGEGKRPTCRARSRVGTFWRSFGRWTQGARFVSAQISAVGGREK